MRGWRVSALGEPSDVLEWVDDLPEPQAGPGQVVVRVLGAACNFPDVLVCQGKYQEQPELPFTTGFEVAGEVVAVGEGARAAVGDRVLGTPPRGRGAHAERTVLDGAATFAWPKGMSPAQAAGMFVTYHTGWYALHDRGQLRAGETLLVHAAAGGVGTAAVQLGKAAGARVIGTAGGPEKCALVRELGADEVVDYSAEDLVARVKELTGGRGADVVYDPVGGDVFDASRRVVAPEGRILVIGFAGGRFADAPTNHILIKNYSVVGVHMGFYRSRHPDAAVGWHDELCALWQRGAIAPVIGAELPMTELPEALRRLASRGTTGKVVVTP